ncbi:MAG: LysR family transcriptional regulator [Maricaulaceae bacterium]
MDWDKLKSFHKAAESGSLTAAAEALTLSQSAVSRQIAALEEQLGVALFHRHARGLTLTEQGRLLRQTTEDIAARVGFAEAMLRDSRDKPSGDLRVTAPLALGAMWLAPRLKDFLERFPEIRLQLLLDDAELDVANLEADCAVRLWSAKQGDLVQTKIGVVRQHLYASSDYVARHGAPQTLDALDQHRLVAYGASRPTPMTGIDWAFTADPSKDAACEPQLKINNVAAILAAVEAGLGVASLPDYVAIDRKLVRILPELEGPKFDLHFIYPEELRNSKRIAAFRDFVKSAASYVTKASGR